MAHDKVFGICESKCKVEIMSKEEIEHENEEMIRRAVLIATGKEPLTEVDTSTNYYNLTLSQIEEKGYVETHFVESFSSFASYSKEETTLTRLPYPIDTSNATSLQAMFWRRAGLIELPKLNTSKVTNFNSTFSHCRALSEIPAYDFSEAIDMGYAFRFCENLLSLPKVDFSKVENLSYCFDSCTALTSIPDLDMKSVTNTDSMFKNCTSLTTFTDSEYAPEGSRWQIKNNFDVSSCPLDRESILKVFNGAQTVEEKTISISSVTNSYLSDEDKAIITDKGWTITVV